MEGCYEVYQSGAAAGKVQIVRQGLYYKIHCRCRPSGDQVHRLYAVSDSGRENLGVVIPEGDGFVLDTKIPVRRLGTGRVIFQLSGGWNRGEGVFVPICPEEPFAYIERLKDAFLETENGKAGIRIMEKPGAQ